MISVISLILFLCLITISFIFSWQFPKRVKRKNILAYQNDTLTKKKIVQRTLLRLFLPGIEVPIVMLLLMVCKQFHFEHTYLAYVSFVISTLLVIAMMILGIYYYKKEFQYVYVYEMIFIQHHYDTNTSIRDITSSTDVTLIHASKRMNELFKTSFTQGILQTLVCIIFLLSL